MNRRNNLMLIATGVMVLAYAFCEFLPLPDQVINRMVASRPVLLLVLFGCYAASIVAWARYESKVQELIAELRKTFK